MIIKVTQNHIDRGCRGDGQNCPVALAISEALGRPCAVTEDFIEINLGPDSFTVPTPRVVRGEIIRYDQSNVMRPFEFELDVEGVG